MGNRDFSVALLCESIDAQLQYGLLTVPHFNKAGSSHSHNHLSIVAYYRLVEWEINHISVEIY